MNRLIRLFLSVIFLISLDGISFSKTEDTKSKKYPPFIFKSVSLEDKTVDLSEHVGKKLIMINFWASWCPPCRYEIPDLINLQEEFKDKLLIVGVALDDNVEPVKVFSQKYKFNYPIVHDSSGLISYLYGGITSIPTTFIINYDGKIVERIVGARSFEVFKRYVEKYAKKN